MRFHPTRSRSSAAAVVTCPTSVAVAVLMLVTMVFFTPACVLADQQYNVTVGANNANLFDPKVLNITMADTVRFVWAGSHSLTRVDNGTSCDEFSGPRDKGAIDTGVQSAGYVYTIFPTAAGKAYLTCSQHCVDGMRLTLIVTDDGSRPTSSGPVATTGGSSGSKPDNNSNLAVILGAAIGGVAVVATAFLAFWFVIRTKRRRKQHRLTQEQQILPQTPSSDGPTTSTGTSITGYSPAMPQQVSPHSSTGMNMNMFIPQPPMTNMMPPSPTGPPGLAVYVPYMPSGHETNQMVYDVNEEATQEVVIMPYTGQPSPGSSS